MAPRINKLRVWLKHYLDETNADTFLNKSGSAKAAGYKAKTDESFRAIGCQNFTKLNDEIEKWIDENMLSDTKLKQKIGELMGAKETKFFAHQGEVKEEKDVEALEIQRKTLDMALKVKGMYAPDKVEHSGKIGVPQIEVIIAGKHGKDKP